jgi:glutamate/tyrosine decarboxylase-like PLP-dependent enzyme
MINAADFDALPTAAGMAERYRRRVATAATTPVASYAQMLAAFAGPTPETGEPAGEVVAALEAAATPGIRAMTGPRFFGWVIGSSHPLGVAADWLTSAWGQNAANIHAAPAASAAEAVAAGWLLDLLDLPREASVGFVTGATVANFVCLAAARSAVLARVGWDVEADGLFGAPPITVLIGEEAHVTVYSALKYLGLGAARVKIVPCDDQGRMRADDFETLLAATAGPVIVIGQAGQINTGAFDPFPRMGALCQARGAWLHVDGAFGLWARAAPAVAHLGAGLELADSWATDGHKWLQTPYDSGFAIVKDAEAHRRAMTVTASYLPPASGAERDPSQYVPELSRRARGFAAWAMIRRLGRAGVAEMVERNCRVAARMGERLGAEPGVGVVNDVVLNQLIVRFGEDDTATLATVAQVQADAVAFMGSSDWRGAKVMRISVSSDATTEAEADVACEAVITAWRKVQG